MAETEHKVEQNRQISVKSTKPEQNRIKPGQVEQSRSRIESKEYRVGEQREERGDETRQAKTKRYERRGKKRRGDEERREEKRREQKGIEQNKQNRIEYRIGQDTLEQNRLE